MDDVGVHVYGRQAFFVIHKFSLTPDRSRTDCGALRRLIRSLNDERMAPMQLFLRGIDGATTVLRAATLGELRAAADVDRFSCCGRELVGADSVTLADLGVIDNTTVFALDRLLGGGKKRKKKTYTKPKKLKHKHKKVKLAVLKYYKISGDGKVERLRRECPEATCGTGVFMAAHSDRMYCGRCSLTLVHEDK